MEWRSDRKSPSAWPRVNACLHAEVVPQIIHRDIKASNILLDEDFNSRVADFGLASSPQNETHFTTHVAGTHGYLAPEYALYGQLTEKSDVYSFGVCLLELHRQPTQRVAESSQENPNVLGHGLGLGTGEGRIMESWILTFGTSVRKMWYNGSSWSGHPSARTS